MSSKLVKGVREPYENYYPSDSDIEIVSNIWKEIYWKDFKPLDTNAILKKAEKESKLSRVATKYFDWMILMFDFSPNFIIEDFKLYDKLKYVLKLDDLSINKCKFAIYMMLISNSGRVSDWDDIRKRFSTKFPKFILIYSTYCQDFLVKCLEKLSSSDYEYKFYKKDLQRRAKNVDNMERGYYQPFYMRAVQIGHALN